MIKDMFERLEKDGDGKNVSVGVGGRKMTLCAQIKADPRTGMKEAKKERKKNTITSQIKRRKKEIRKYYNNI